MFLNNMNSCSNTDLEDCKYEPTGINAQFGYNTANLMTKENCCSNKKDIGCCVGVRWADCVVVNVNCHELTANCGKLIFFNLRIIFGNSRSYKKPLGSAGRTALCGQELP